MKPTLKIGMAVGFSFLVAIFYWLSFAAVYAVESTSATSTNDQTKPVCGLETALTSLLKIKDSDMEPTERDKSELTARKNVVTEIVNCSLLELEAFKARLDKLDLKHNDKKDSLLREKFYGDIDASKFYFSNVNDKLISSLDIVGIKELAKNIAAWRASYYVPVVSKMNNFVLMLENEQAIKTAKARFGKISFSLSAVRLSESTDIKNLLNKSTEHINKATELNKQAHDLAWNVDLIFDNASSSPTSTADIATSSEATTSVESATSTEATSTDEAVTNSTSTPETATSTPSTDKILPLIKDSLMELKTAYTNYLAISGLVKKYLGL